MLVCRMGTRLRVALALALLTTGACVVNEAESPSRGVVVSGPPPPAVREERPTAPSPQSVWVVGYWHWTGMQYAWIPGHWDAPPPGAVWNAPVYSARDGKYFYETGGWKTGGTRNALR
jgi:WXXGXW repeat (2 copies)